jgi:hypothetical protein
MQVAQRPTVSSVQRRALGGSVLPAVPRVNICRPLRFKENDDKEVVQTLERKTEESKNSVGAALRAASSHPDYDSEFKVPFWQPAFTRRREIYSGRLAMVGFLAACLGEVYLSGHPNIMQQIAGYFQLADVPISTGKVGLLLLGLVLYNGLGACFPDSATFSQENQQDVAKRPDGPTQTAMTPASNPFKFLGITGLGFTKRNELFTGRLAMLGFAAALLQQLRIGGLNGPGPLGQIAYFFNISDQTAFYAGIPTFVFGFGVFCGVVGYLTGKPGTIKGEDDIY